STAYRTCRRSPTRACRTIFAMRSRIAASPTCWPSCVGASACRRDKQAGMDQTIFRPRLAPSPPPVMIGGAIPLIDVSGFLAGTPGAAEKAAAQLAWAFENVGFYYLAGHGVPRELIEAQYAEAARFHAQPMDEKLKLKVNEH